MQYLCRHIGEERNLVYAWFEAMHTRIDMMLWDTTETDELKCVAGKIENETRRIEQMGSRFLEGSEVDRINKTAGSCPVKVSDELCSLLSRCLEYARQWNGLFDITASEGTAHCPCWERLVINPPFVTRIDGSARIDLSGCLKGYALDCAVAMLKQAGIRNGLLSFGNSSVYGLGNHPNGSGWPVADENALERQHVLHDECLTTSGNNTQTRRHIVHPLTGKLVEGKRTASVITSTGEEGEVLSIVKFLSEAGSDD